MIALARLLPSIVAIAILLAAVAALALGGGVSLRLPL